MNIVPLSVEIISPDFDVVDEDDILKIIEVAGRTAYKSENRITPSSASRFVKKIITLGHESVLEHVNVTVRFVCDRGVTHELVRHRIAAYTQESTRYCDYGGGITVIRPLDLEDGSAYQEWYNAMLDAERHYMSLIDEFDKPPQLARHVLPISVKTEIVTTMNIREWRHVVRIRTSKGAHPHIRKMMDDLLTQFMINIPKLFEDIER